MKRGGVQCQTSRICLKDWTRIMHRGAVKFYKGIRKDRRGNRNIRNTGVSRNCAVKRHINMLKYKEETTMEFKRIIDENRETYMAELFEVLRQESISAEDRGIRECVELVAGKLTNAGMDSADIIETDLHTTIHGEYHISDEAQKMLIYGDYDVQPPDPVEEWESTPFEPGIRDGIVYDRGDGDNKGQVKAQILAVKTYIEAE